MKRGVGEVGFSVRSVVRCALLTAGTQGVGGEGGSFVPGTGFCSRMTGRSMMLLLGNVIFGGCTKGGESS